jgi:hypothetical protein
MDEREIYCAYCEKRCHAPGSIFCSECLPTCECKTKVVLGERCHPKCSPIARSLKRRNGIKKTDTNTRIYHAHVLTKAADKIAREYYLQRLHIKVFYKEFYKTAKKQYLRVPEAKRPGFIEKLEDNEVKLNRPKRFPKDEDDEVSPGLLANREEVIRALDVIASQKTRCIEEIRELYWAKHS